MSEPEVQRCVVVDAPRGWPALHVLAVAHPRFADPAAGREAARRRLRALLLRHAGPEIAAPLLTAARAARGAGRASFSHEQSHSLLAWCEQGCIGIDIVSPQRLADMTAPALAATAALYLGPQVSALIRSTPEVAQACKLFAEAWASHEASLKCLGLALDEWSPGLQLQLTSCLTAAVAPPAQDCAGSALWVARIAWRSPFSAQDE